MTRFEMEDIAGGPPYPIPASFVIYQSGGKTYAENLMGGVDIVPDTDAATVIQNAINAVVTLPGGIGGIIFVRAGVYTINSKLTITGNAVTLEGEGIQTRFDYAGSDACVEIGNDVSSFFYNTVREIRVNLTNSSATAVGVRIKGNTYYGVLDRIRVSGNLNYATGIEFQVNTTFITGWTIINPFMTAVKIGFLIDGTGPAGQGVTDLVILGGFVNGQSNGVSGSIGISTDRPDTMKVYGLSLNGFETMVKETVNTNANEYYGLRMETCVTGFNFAGIDALVLGGSIAGHVTALIDTGTRTSVQGLNGQFSTRVPRISVDTTGNTSINAAPGANLLLGDKQGNLIVVARALYPNTDNAFDIGFSITQRFKNIYFAGSSTIAPTTTDIPSGGMRLWKNTTDASVKLYYNDAGTLKSVTLT